MWRQKVNKYLCVRVCICVRVCVRMHVCAGMCVHVYLCVCSSVRPVEPSLESHTQQEPSDCVMIAVCLVYPSHRRLKAKPGACRVS